MSQGIVRGELLLKKEEAIELGALCLQEKLGDYDESKQIQM